MSATLEVDNGAITAQFASSILEEKHMVSIIMYLAENDGCKKTDLYSGVSRNGRMPLKLEMLEDAGIITMDRGSKTVLIRMTEVGREVAGQLRALESVLSSTVQGVND